ncbi:MAG: HAD family hydrolase [Lachnospiraceae bacterium]|nr:HAD family hydrolase [Lachnospiraceae bacterium]
MHSDTKMPMGACSHIGIFCVAVYGDAVHEDGARRAESEWHGELANAKHGEKGKIIIMYDLVLFDLDGTLVNTIKGLVAAVNHSLSKYGLKTRTEQEVQSFVGNGIRKLIERSVPEGTSTDITDKVFGEFKSYYVEHCLDNLEEYPGIKELVKELYEKSVPMAVVTNKNDAAAKKIIKQFFGDKISVVIGAHENIPKKPAPDMVNMAFDEINRRGITFKNPVFVGDSEVDIQTALNSGMSYISVSYGFKTREFLEQAGAKTIAEDAEELKRIL